MSTITNIKAREILDSRGNPTIEVDLYTNNNTVHTAAVPSGVSTGVHEAVELRDKNKNRYLGQGVQKAVRNIEKEIFPHIKKLSCREQKKIDQLMIKIDGTKNKSRLGANAILAVSLAVSKVGALNNNLPLYKYIHQLLGNKNVKKNIKKNIKTNNLCLPRPFFNIINGGKHAGNKLAFQEFMISPHTKSFKENLRISSEVYHHLKIILEKKYGKQAVNVGDEGGFAPPLRKAEQALELLTEAIKKAGYLNKVGIAIDAAASEFYLPRKKTYRLHKKFTKKKLLNYYLKLIDKYPIISIEDPFEQEDFESFAELRKQIKQQFTALNKKQRQHQQKQQNQKQIKKQNVQIVGDDLTVTNVERIKEAIKKKSCDCLLLKVNQIGTLSESLEAVRLAYKNGWEVMVSHRSGETEDTFIADLAVGIGCGMIKAGAPCRGERTAKYNRLLKIEEILKKY